MIDEFKGEYRFFSNFWFEPVIYDDVVYPTNEHAFQAAKTLDKIVRDRIRQANSPTIAKRLGRQVQMCEDWEYIKDNVMYLLNLQKFSNNEILKQKLLSTGDQELIEGNKWHDRVWGMSKDSNGVWQGQNKLGKILMKIREELKNA